MSIILFIFMLKTINSVKNQLISINISDKNKIMNKNKIIENLFNFN